MPPLLLSFLFVSLLDSTCSAVVHLSEESAASLYSLPVDFLSTKLYFKKKKIVIKGRDLSLINCQKKISLSAFQKTSTTCRKVFV